MAQATGFVVDATRGIIMTNRHVAGPGPVVAEAIFQNNEEAHLEAVYYDPVHDFAFFRFDPKAIRHMKVVELDLKPEQAPQAQPFAPCRAHWTRRPSRPPLRFSGGGSESR